MLAFTWAFLHRNPDAALEENQLPVGFCVFHVFRHDFGSIP